MKKIFENISNWLKKVFNKGLDEAQEHASHAVGVVNAIKKYLDLPAFDLFAALTPFGYDDVALAAIRKALANVAAFMLAAESVVVSDVSDDDKIMELVKLLKDKLPAGRIKWWVEMAARLLIELMDGDTNLARATAVTQVEFDKLN